MSEKLVPVRVFDNLIEAETARSLLESEGLIAFVFKDDAGGMRPHLQPSLGVRLVVPEDQLEEAREILGVEA